jgi:hypothetical protein
MDEKFSIDDETVKRLRETEKAHREAIRRRVIEQRRKVFTRMFAMVVPMIAGAMAIVLLFFGDSILKPVFLTDSDSQQLQSQITQLQSDVKTLGGTFKSVVPVSIDSLNKLNAQNVELVQLKYRVEALTVELQNISSTVLEDPQRALTLPLLKQRIDFIIQENERHQIALHAEVTRVYDMNKWLFGLVITSILGLALSNMWKTGKKE